MNPTDAETVAAGVLRLPLRTPTLPPATCTNTLLVWGTRLVIIEPATPHADEQERLVGEVERLAAAGVRPYAIVLTHHHGDHVGFAAPLRERLGGAVPILAHPETAARLSFAIDRPLDDGDTLTLGDGVELRAVFTPGHAPGHLVLLETRSRVAYVGDMLAGEGTILIDPYDGGDMAAYLDSLRRIDALGAVALVPAHGPVLRAPGEAIAAYVAHRRAREAAVLSAITGEPRPLAAVLAASYADTPQWLWPLAERSLEAHLRKLVAERLVERDGENVWRLRDVD
ncbi:MAG: MBL fold metallo-hydrolase [Deltaproteobacteria bacterium]|nr:MBL fold metallo-hydrolase [Deltaproteobacteria bacterium]